MAQPPEDHRQYHPPPPPPSAMAPGHAVYSQYHQGRPIMMQDGPPMPPQSLQQNNIDAKGRKYSLRVVQEPQRARMCGFGDKDRRPITPPPCVLLTISDSQTGRPIDIAELDVSYFVLSVDLWTADARLEINLVRHSATSPSISATTPSSYPPLPAAAPAFYGGPHMIGSQYAHHYPYAPPQGAPGYPPQHQAYPAGPHLGPGALYPPPMAMSNGVMQVQDPRSAPSGMYTRNLIGSLSVTASKLQDTQGQLGIWFILQDLSIRTEGLFRLQMRLTNISIDVIGGAGNELNKGEAPILATVFSQEFQVYSAKKFPGVIESTPLSKCFATQGVKIPIRKDGPSKGQDDDD